MIYFPLSYYFYFFVSVCVSTKPCPSRYVLDKAGFTCMVLGCLFVCLLFILALLFSPLSCCLSRRSFYPLLVDVISLCDIVIKGTDALPSVQMPKDQSAEAESLESTSLV
eukprot:03646_1